MNEDLPEGWCSAPIRDVADVFLGKTPAKADYVSEGKLKVVKFRDLHNGGIDFSQSRAGFIRDDDKAALRSMRELRSGDVLITSAAHSAENIGKKCAFVAKLPTGFDRVYFTGELLNIRCSEEPIGHWVYFFFRSSDGFAEIQAAVSGVHLTGGRAQVMNVPVAPIAEQRRIVATLAQLIDKADACQRRLAKVPLLLKRFRQSVLAAACSGRLTADWRSLQAQNTTATTLLKEIKQRRRDIYIAKRATEQLPLRQYPEPARPSDEFAFEAPDSWARCSVDDLTTTITSGSRDWTKFYREDGPGTFIMAQNVRPLRFDSSYRLAVAPPRDDRDRKRSEVRKDDLLVTIVGANTGDSCRISLGLEEHYVCQSVALMRPVLADTSRFLELFLNSPEHGLAEYSKWMYGEGRPHLSFDNLRETVVSLPPLAEQQEIVHRVEELFTLVDRLEARLATAQGQADRLTPALLVKAFRGELVPTEAELARQEERDYEPASVLLERVQSERTANPAQSKASIAKKKDGRAAQSFRGSR